MIKQTLMIQGKDSLSLDFASFSLIFAYSSKESCLAFFEVDVGCAIFKLV